MESYGLVLGGGGAKGAYEIGVWKALRELKIPIIAVTGTSIGALNGAAIVQGDYEKTLELWEDMDIESIIDINEDTAQSDSRGKVRDLVKFLTGLIKYKGIDITPLRHLLESIIDEEKIRKSKVEFGIVTYSMTDMKPIKIFKEEIPEGKMLDYLLASAALPAFQPLEIEGKRYIDGAVHDNIPISLMLEKDIRNIIAVDVSGFGLVKKVKEEDFNIIWIKNSEYLGATLGFTKESIKKNIKIGYYDTMRAFEKLDGKNYYFTNLENDFEIKTKDIKRIYEFIGIKWDKRLNPKNRVLIYKLIRNLKKYSNVKKFKNTKMALVAAAEITAEVMEIDRIKEYSLEELIDAIMQEYNARKDEDLFSAFAEIFDDESNDYEEIGFIDRIKMLVQESRFAALHSIDIEDNSDKAVLYRRFLGLTFPKICIANIFIAFIDSKYFISRDTML